MNSSRIHIRDILYHDIHSIFQNPAAILILLVLSILPACYAWFNIVASWDPYGNTHNIKVAVSNEDSNTRIIDNLKKNTSMGWEFVSTEEAKYGTQTGKYYASIIIPADFSENMLSFLTKNPKKAKIIYTVNEKINAIVPKITQKGAESLESQIESAFISSISEQLFQKTNVTGKMIQQYQKDFVRARALIDDISKQLPEIYELLQKSQEIGASGNTAIKTLIASIPEISQGLDHIIHTTHSIPSFHATIVSAIHKIPETIAEGMSFLQLLLQDSSLFFNSTHNLATSASEVLLPKIHQFKNTLERANRIVQFLGKTFTRANTIFSKKPFDPIIKRNSLLQQKIGASILLLSRAEHTLKQGETLTSDTIVRIQKISATLDSAYQDLQQTINQTLHPAMESIQKYVQLFIQSLQNQAMILQENIPTIQTFLEKTQSVIVTGNTKIHLILQQWPKISQTITQMQKVANKLSDDRIDSLLALLLLDPLHEKDFFQHPITLESHHLFPLPNYGSAISPFFTTLALWVGALLSVSVLSVRSRMAHKQQNLRYGYLGRLLFFLILGIIQASITAIGNITFIGVSIQHPEILIPVSILIALIFQLIVYSLVYLFGNSGKVLAILLLLLQLSAAGGTFPVELTNSFFIHIHPYLPFTYAINALREITGGIVLEVFWYNIGILTFIGISVFIISWLLAPYLARSAIAFDKKTKQIDIFH